MAQDETRSTLDAYLGALVSGGDFAQYFSPDVVWRTTETGEEIRGREAVRDYIVGVHTRAFDAHPELVSSVTGPGFAMLEALFIGTHTGTFAGLEPTGAQVRVPYCMAYDIEGGQITALRCYLSTAALTGQILAAKTSGARPAHV